MGLLDYPKLPCPNCRSTKWWYMQTNHGNDWLGTASEIFDGDAPFTPRGCIAQAWSVAEILSAWREIENFSRKARPAKGPNAPL